MPAFGSSSATLLIRGDDLDPVELNDLLQVAPSSAVRKGQPGRSAHNPAKVFEIGHWRIEAERCEPGDLDTQITDLIGRLPVNSDVWSELGRRFRIEMFCGVFMDQVNELAEIRPQTLGLLAERGITLTLDLYGGSAEH